MDVIYLSHITVCNNLEAEDRAIDVVEYLEANLSLPPGKRERL